MKLNLDYLLEKLWEYLALTCIYTKKRGRKWPRAEQKVWKTQMLLLLTRQTAWCLGNAGIKPSLIIFQLLGNASCSVWSCRVWIPPWPSCCILQELNFHESLHDIRNKECKFTAFFLFMHTVMNYSAHHNPQEVSCPCCKKFGDSHALGGAFDPL